MNIIILGAGAFGTAIGNALAVNVNNNVVIFSTNKQKVDEINMDNTNKSCFPNKQLTKTLTATTNKKDIKNADIVFVALPSTVVIEYLLSIRSFLISSISEGISFVDNALESEDVKSTIEVVKRLGIKVKKIDNKKYQVYGKGLGSFKCKNHSFLNFGVTALLETCIFSTIYLILGQILKLQKKKVLILTYQLALYFCL